MLLIFTPQRSRPCGSSVGKKPCFLGGLDCWQPGATAGDRGGVRVEVGGVAKTQGLSALVRMDRPTPKKKKG